MKKRIISLLLVLMLILPVIQMLGITVSAEDNVALNETSASVIVESAWGTPGGTVDVNLVLSDNPGILGATITISWNESLTLIADASGEAFDHMTYTSPSRYVASGTNFVWFGNEVDEVIDGTILTLTFQVSETAQNNDILPVRVTYTLGDVIDENDNDVILNITDGSVRVITYQPGDVTGDGRVNARDLVRLSQYISDGCKTDPEGYNAEVVGDACDVNGDGRVNARDLIKLSQYISDGSQTNPDGYNAVLKPAKLPECGHANMQATAAKEASCIEVGNIAYWYCSGCGKYFSDAAGTTEITFADTVLTNGAHTLTAVVAKSATCTDVGNIAYWNCSVCEKYFSDANATVEILLTDTVISAQGHDLTKITENAASCTEVGNVTYWYCEVCQKSYSDEDAETEIDADSTVITAKGHAVQAVIAKSATCTQPGNVAYWYCSACEGRFGDSDAKNEISLAETMIDAIGHGENLKHIDKVEATIDTKGNEEYWKCSVCGKCYSNANAETEVTEVDMIIPIVPSYTITFVDKLNYPEGKDVKFSQSEKLLLTTYLPPEVEGYTFDGWYTTSTYGDANKKDYVLAGQKEDFFLYAKWTPIEYHIYYEDAPENSNATIYTVEQEVVLLAPKWTGLIFKNWTDAKGNIVKKINKGSVGDITLTANWISEENFVEQADENSEKIVLFDEDLIRYYFIYEAGTIDNVVLKTVEIQDKKETEELKWTKSDTITVGKNIADTVAKTVSESYSKTEGWEKSRGFVLSESFSTTSSLSVGLEADSGGLKGKIETSLEVTTSTEATLSKQYGSSGSTETGTETSNMASSTVSFFEECSATVTTENTISGEMPAGTYKNVCVGKVYVYVVVTYDALEKNYYIDTYNVLDSTIRGKRLYEAPTDCTANIHASDSLNFAIPQEEILAYVDSHHYVKYDANKPYAASNDVTDMPKAESYIYGQNITLASSPSLEGWTFQGWGTNANISSKLGDAGETLAMPNLTAEADGGVTLYALWEANTYTISYDTAGGTDIPQSTHTCGETVASPEAPLRSGCRFIGWKFYNTDTGEEINFAFGDYMSAHDITAVAQWLLVTTEVVLGDGKTVRYTVKYYDGKSSFHDDTIHTCLNRDLLIEEGYEKIKISMTFWCKVYDWGDQKIQILSSSGDEVKTLIYDWGDDDEWLEKTVEYELLLSQVDSDCGYKIKWAVKDGAGTDTWYVGGVTLSITATK